ncbi:flavoprotein monooxygenase [Lasiosphaeria hispida]|uniref:Flavoprotein monooxygenase n=1 Tax=Lasiosphaeria hispida TaxID=260671 RepID=A0AAJ0HSU6_9PEZI|nr:flavoprotein monooxygenase [Lasiosphaeria hispida]
MGKFRVVIVGGGPIRLTAAHALPVARVDFLVLERRPNIVEDQGARTTLVVYPHTFRVMHQFVILEPLLSIGSKLDHHLSFTADGHVFKEGSRYTRVHQNNGYGATAFHRAKLIEILYNGLPAAAKRGVLTGKSLVDITTQETGVEVNCADGSVYWGSIVIGADEPFMATCQLLFGAFPTPSEPDLGYDTQAKDKSIMYLSGPNRSWFFLYKRLPKPISERAKYTDEDAQALAREFAEYPLTAAVEVEDLWPTMLGAGMTNLQEGIAQHWSLGRIVIVGDGCYKFTAHLGLGFNNGVQDIVVLCNGLRKAVRAALDENPDPAVLKTWLVIPKFVEDTVARYISPELCKGQVLDYVRTEEVMEGEMRVHPMSALAAT